MSLAVRRTRSRGGGGGRERKRRWKSRKQMMRLQAPGSTDSLLRNSLPFLFISPLKFSPLPALLLSSSPQWMTTEQRQIRQTSGGPTLAGCPDRLRQAPEQSMSAHNGASASGLLTAPRGRREKRVMMQGREAVEGRRRGGRVHGQRGSEI